MKSGFFMIFLLLLLANYEVVAQKTEETIRNGNELYRQKQYEQAEAAYTKALTYSPGNTTAAFNRAAALYRQSKPLDAIRELEELVMNTMDAGLKAKAYYNKGAILSAQNKLEESIAAYKNALRNDPNDTLARQNLQKALLELKKKSPPPPPKEDKKKQQQQQKKQQQQPKMNRQEAEQQLKLLEQKEKEVQQRLQKEKSGNGTGQEKDW